MQQDLQNKLAAFRKFSGKITLNICNSLKPCYCIVTERKNSVHSGSCHRHGSNFPQHILAYRGLYPQGSARDCARVLNLYKPFSLLRKNSSGNNIINSHAQEI